MISLNASTLSRQIDARQQPSPSQQLDDAVQQHDLQTVRELISSDSAARQEGRAILDRSAVESAIFTLFEDDGCKEDRRTELSKALAGYGGFDRRRIPGFVFDLRVSDAKQVIQHFVAAGTAPRIGSKDSEAGDIRHTLREFVHKLQKERLQQYAAYRKEKISKHSLKDEAPLSPFFYKKRDAKLSLNGRIKGIDKDAQSAVYWCRHIETLMRGKEQNGAQSHQALKARLDLFSNKESAGKLLNSLGYAKLEASWNTAGPDLLCSNAEFGKLLYKLSGELKEGDSTAYRLFFQASATSSHVMTLHVHKRNGRFCVGVHDPNVTANMKHMEYLTEDKEGITKATLRQFMDVNYGTPVEFFSVVGVSPFFTQKYSGRLLERDLLRLVEEIWSALAEGNSVHIRATFEKFKRKEIDGRVAHLLGDVAAGRQGGRAFTGLVQALCRGHAEAVKAFGDFLKLLPENQRALVLPGLLRAKNSKNVPGLHFALANGHAETVRAYGDLLNLIPENQRIDLLPDLLAAKNAAQVPGLYFALVNGLADTVTAFGELLNLVPKNQRVTILPDLLKARDEKQVPALYFALEGGHAESVKAFADLLNLLSESQRSTVLPELIEAKNDHVHGLHFALGEGRAETVEAFGALLSLIPETQRADILPDLLEAKDARQLSGLYFALQNGRAEAVKAFGNLLELIPENRRVAILPRLLEAKNSRQVPGLYHALRNNHADTVKAFAKLVELVPIDARTSIVPGLLAAKDANGLSGLAAAFIFKAVEAALAFAEIVEAVAPRLSRSARADLMESIRGSYKLRAWYTLGIWVYLPAYLELKENRAFHEKFKAMKRALKR